METPLVPRSWNNVIELAAEEWLDEVDPSDPSTYAALGIRHAVAPGQAEFERCREILRDFVEEVGIMRQKTTEHRKQLEREIGELNRRIDRWEEAFETRREDADVIMPKLRDLRGKRDELAATLSKIVPLRAVPPYLYNETTIRKFQENIRELFLSKDTSLTRNYLRFLVQDITVRGAEITIRGRTDAAVALLASGAEPGTSPLNQSSAVLTSVVDWRPRRDLNARPSV